MQVELEFTLKDSKISKVLTKIEVDKSLKVALFINLIVEYKSEVIVWLRFQITALK